MKYYPTTDKSWLDEVNRRGLPEGSGDITKGWTDVIQHPATSGLFAAVVPPNVEANLGKILTSDEISMVSTGLKSEEEMIAAGWTQLIIDTGFPQ